MFDMNNNGIVDGGDQPMSYARATLYGLHAGINEHYAGPLQSATADFAGIVRFNTHAADGQSVMVGGYSCTTQQLTILCAPVAQAQSALRSVGTVYFIYFVPQDRAVDPRIENRIWELAREAQQNYRGSVGSTFPVYYKTLVVQGDRNRRYYSETPDGIHSLCQYYYLGNIWKEVKRKIGGVDWDPDHRYVIYSDVDICQPSDHYAAANLGTAQLPATATASADLFGKVGSMVTNHELGHALTLLHNTTNVANCMYPTVQEIFPCLFSNDEVDELLANNPGFWGSGGIDRELPNGDGGGQPPVLSITGGWFPESDGTASFRLSLDSASSDPVSVTVYTTPVSAGGHGVDYRGFTRTVLFEPGSTEKIINIIIVDDELPEGDEEIRMRLTAVDGATLDRDSALIRIIDDDSDVRDAVYIEPMSTMEDVADDATVVIRLSNAQALPVSVKFKTEDDSALNGIDYYGNYQELSFQPGETTKTVAVKIINDDQREPDKSLNLRLLDPVNAVLLSGGLSSLKILDDESR